MDDPVDGEVLEQVKAKILRGSEKYAERAGYKLSPDSEVVRTIITGLARNKLKYRYSYCPCFFISGNPEEDKKLICPCQYHREDIEKHGKCHCGLFVKSN